MNPQRIAAFSDGETGGNPAGVYISDQHPATHQMQSIAAEVGYSETVFAKPLEDKWRVRYFSPESEVPFCGHATIALGAALAKRAGAGLYRLVLNETEISVEGFIEAGDYSASLQSPETHASAANPALIDQALSIFGYDKHNLDNKIPPAMAHGGADHLIVALNSRAELSAMKYDLDDGRKFMRQNDLVTVMFVYAESNQLFHARNPFASGGVYEDPATGAATAAFSGYLRDIKWPHAGAIKIVQGEDMGSRSLIKAEFSNTAGESIRVSGTVRDL